MTRNKVLLIAIPVILVLALVLLLPLLVDKQQILELASAKIKEQTGADLTVGEDVSLTLFPSVGLSLSDISLAMPSQEQASLEVGSMQLGLQLMPLLSGLLQVDSLTLQGLISRIEPAKEAEAVNTSGMSDRELDDFYAQRKEKQAAAAANATSRAALAVPLALNVQTLKVSDSRLELLDPAGAPATVIEIEELEASDLNLDGRPVQLRLALRLPGKQPAELRLDATVRLDQTQQTVLVDELELTIEGATAATIQLQAQGEIDINRQIANLQLEIEIAETRGAGSLRYAAFESPRIDADMQFNLFDPALLALAGPEAASGAQSEPTDDLLPLEALRSIDTRAQLSIDRAVLGGQDLKNLKLTLRAVDGQVQLEPVTAMLHGGQLELSASFNGRHNTAILNTGGKLSGLDLATALTANDKKPLATGQANLNWQLESRGKTRTSLLNTLAGPVELTTDDVLLQGVGVERILCTAVALTNQEALTAAFPADTRFQTLRADIQLLEGVARLQPLRAELPNIQLQGTGTYALTSGDFDTTFEARLSPGLEDLDRACRVSKRLTAIAWPVDCKGNVAGEPGKWCSVDTAEIIQDLTVNEAQKKIQKKAGKLMEKLFN